MPIGHGASAPVGHAGIGKSVPALRAERGRNFGVSSEDSVEPMPSRKASLLEVLATVPQTDTGGLG